MTAFAKYLLSCLLAGALAPTGLALAVENDSFKMPSFAPAEDLTAQVDFYLGRLGEALAAEAEYNQELQSRVTKDSNTVAALGLCLAFHETKNKYSGGGLIGPAQQLAENAANFAAAAKALEALRQAASSEQPKKDDLKWGKVAELDALMQQVPIVNNGLRRGLEANRFARQAKQNAGQSATLGAIAQAAMFDHSAAEDAAAAAQWEAFCRDMREAAAEINRSVHAGQAEPAQAGAKRLAENCDACHARFRGEE